MTDTVVVVPCFNEEDRLRPSAFRRFAGENPWVRFHFVDDGSTDGTRRVLRSLVGGMPDAAGLRALPANRGKAEAVRRGVVDAYDGRPAFVGYWDADLATPLAAIGDLREVLEERPRVDLALGSRVKLMGRDIERRSTRHYLGRVFASFASLATGLPVYDTQCGAKLLRANDTVRRLFASPFLSDWFFDVELLARYLHRRREEPRSRVEEAIYELPLSRWRDVPDSRLGVGDMLRAPLVLARIWWRYTRHV